MTSFLVTIALIGFIALKFYRHRTKEVHDIANGWNLVFSSLFWGFISSIPAYALLKYFVPKISLDLVFSLTDLKEEYIFSYFALAILFSLLIAFLTSTLCFQNFLTKFSKFIVVDSQPIHPAGLIPANLNELTQDRILISLKSGKVYVGLLLRVDINEKIVYENRGIEILPFKSGFRKSDKSVQYNTRYVDVEGHLNPLPITIKIADIESFTKFSVEIDKYFSDLKKKKKSVTKKAPAPK